MKLILNVLALLTVLIGYSQSSSNNQLVDNNAEQLFNTGRGNFGSMLYVNNPKFRTIGTYYLFDNWDNYCVIHTSGNKKFAVRNLNLNLRRNIFESKVGNDSLFAFNFNNIEKIVIDGKVYKNYFWNDDSRVYEVLYENDNMQLLKGFDVKFVEGSANPMLNRKYDKFVRKEYYFVRIDGKIKPIKLKKKKILKLLDQKNVMKVEEYAKRNKLSFNDEEEIGKILEYSESL